MKTKQIETVVEPTSESPIRPAFRELNMKKLKSLETQVKELKGVKEVAVHSKAKKIKLVIVLDKKEDDEVFQSVIELASNSNFKIVRSYYHESDLIVNLNKLKL